MSESPGKNIKLCVYHPKYRSKLTFLIRGPVHSADEYKFMEEFIIKYAKVSTTKDRIQNLQPRKVWKTAREQ